MAKVYHEIDGRPYVWKNVSWFDKEKGVQQYGKVKSYDFQGANEGIICPKCHMRKALNGSCDC